MLIVTFLISAYMCHFLSCTVLVFSFSLVSVLIYCLIHFIFLSHFWGVGVGWSVCALGGGGSLLFFFQFYMQML